MRCPVCDSLIDPLYFYDECPECDAPLYDEVDGCSECEEECSCFPYDEFDEAGLPVDDDESEDIDDYPLLPSEEEEPVEEEDLNDEEE